METWGEPLKKINKTPPISNIELGGDMSLSSQLFERIVVQVGPDQKHKTLSEK
jgi:hypothetical protein